MRAPLTVAAAEEKLREVLLYAQEGDHERAHSLEDELHISALSTIAEGRAENPRELADIAVRTIGINFARWCA